MERLKFISLLVLLLAIVCFLPLIMMGLKPHVSRDLIDYMQNVQLKKQSYHEEIPIFKKEVILRYSAEQFRDPFVPYVTNSKEKIAPLTERPDLNRPREALEAYPLETLTMVGTISQEGVFYVLIKDQSGIVHRLGIGNYLGKNSGQIKAISLSDISIEQLMTDNKGGWREVPIKLYLKQNTGGSKN